jgi:hypothetical protein
MSLDCAAIETAPVPDRRGFDALKSPAMGVDRFLDNLLRQGLVQTVKSLATYKAIL